MKWIAIVPAILTLWLGCALWAKARLPQVDHNQPPWTGPIPEAPQVIHYYAAMGVFRDTRALPLGPVTGGEIYILGMDGTWWIDFPATFHAMMLRPDTTGIRVLLAWPLLRRVSRERAEYVATHPETWVTS